MVTNIFQVIVITILAFVLIFGVGFILNMLLKTTWFPIYAYLALIIGLYVYYNWNSGHVLTAVTEYGFIDLLAILGGVLGGYVSGLTIRALRVKGFKMF